MSSETSTKIFACLQSSCSLYKSSISYKRRRNGLGLISVVVYKLHVIRAQKIWLVLEICNFCNATFFAFIFNEGRQTGISINASYYMLRVAHHSDPAEFRQRSSTDPANKVKSVKSCVSGRSKRLMFCLLSSIYNTSIARPLWSVMIVLSRGPSFSRVIPPIYSLSDTSLQLRMWPNCWRLALLSHSSRGPAI